MENFIPTIRTDRFREIKKYEDRGYTFIDKRSYRMIDKIETKQKNYTFEYGVEVTQQDIFFYITDKSANIYLSFIQIYDILNNISYKEGIDFVVDILKKQMDIKVKKEKSNLDEENKKGIKNQEKFTYRGIDYGIRKTVESTKTGKVKIQDSSLEISYEYLIMLINLIQEKSNTLFLQGSVNKKYVDGILRMLTVLLSNNEDIDILTSIGWKYNDRLNKFEYYKPESETERTKKKYYLTKAEYETIME